MKWNLLSETADFLNKRLTKKPRIAVILGSGVSDILKLTSPFLTIPYTEIPNFPHPSIEGHKGALDIGLLGGKTIAILRGRAHYYEGYSLDDITLPVRVLRLLRAEYLITTGASGSLTNKLKPTDIMLIADHINMVGENPLRGKNLDKIGPRFPDMSNAYDKKLQEIAKQSARKSKITLKCGVYLAVSGPSYETSAEIRMFRLLKADAIGMSVVPETISAVHCGLKVLGLAYITNMSAGLDNKRLTHKDVLKTSSKIKHKLDLLIQGVIESL